MRSSRSAKRTLAKALFRPRGYPRARQRLRVGVRRRGGLGREAGELRRFREGLLPFFSFEGLFEPDGGLISLRVRDSKGRGGSSRRSSSVGRLGRPSEA